MGECGLVPSWCDRDRSGRDLLHLVLATAQSCVMDNGVAVRVGIRVVTLEATHSEDALSVAEVPSGATSAGAAHVLRAALAPGNGAAADEEECDARQDEKERHDDPSDRAARETILARRNSARRTRGTGALRRGIVVGDAAHIRVRGQDGACVHAAVRPGAGYVGNSVAVAVAAAAARIAVANLSVIREIGRGWWL